ncbi:MAG: tetratricopeptide repeat protein [Planctomycetia bacterium]|nr:tetratricopeptide repeat protein [Planctomycetia bacterium]
MPTIAETFTLAFAHHQRGELAQAQRIYRQILEADPKHADAWHLLGVAAHQSGRHVEAIGSISKAIALNGSIAAYHNHLGAAHAALGELDQAEISFRRAVQLGESDSQGHYNLAALLNLRAKPAEAIACYQRAVQLNPKFAEAHFNLGNALRDSGELAEAEQSYARALAARPGYIKAGMNLANVQLKQDKARQAEATLRQVLEIDPHHVEANFRLGSLWHAQGKLAEAAQALQLAVVANPRHADAQNNLGCAFRGLDRFDQAEQCFRLALAAKPDFAEAHNNLGSVLQQKKEYEAAAQCYQSAIDLRPDFAEAFNNWGSLCQDQKQFDSAMDYYRKALALQPDSADTLANLGTVLQMQGKPAESIAYHRRALTIRPDNHQSHFSLGAALHLLGQEDEALASYAEAIRIKPDYAEAYHNRSFVRLSQGDLAAGWPDYEWRLKCKDYKGRRFDAPTWNGSPLAGRTLLVHAEQGLGDALQFIRYVKLAEQSGGEVIVEVQPALVRLLQASGFGRVIGGGSPLPRFDLHIHLLSLPGIFNTTLESVPADVPYLAADPPLIATWRQRLDSYPGFKIGIAWQGNAAYTFDHFRSIRLSEFAPLAEVEGVTIISLQKNAGLEQLAALADRFTAVELGSSLDNEAGAFMDTAAVMRNLDLVVTCDTSILHLAGGLGVPVWAALSSASEWRWMKDRSTSPWYPTMRLFRQRRLDDWRGVFLEMQTELTKLLVGRSTAPSPGQITGRSPSADRGMVTDDNQSPIPSSQ